MVADGCGRLHMVVDSCGRQSYSSEHTSTPNPPKLNKLKQTRTLRYAFETQRYQRHQPISKKTTVNRKPIYIYIYLPIYNWTGSQMFTLLETTVLNAINHQENALDGISPGIATKFLSSGGLIGSWLTRPAMPCLQAGTPFDSFETPVLFEEILLLLCRLWSNWPRWWNPKHTWEVRRVILSAGKVFQGQHMTAQISAMQTQPCKHKHTQTHTVDRVNKLL